MENKVPTCRTILRSPMSGGLLPLACIQWLRTTMWPLELTGRNSATPWTTARIRIWARESCILRVYVLTCRTDGSGFASLPFCERDVAGIIGIAAARPQITAQLGD